VKATSTKSNLKTAAIIIGVIIAVIVLWNIFSPGVRQSSAQPNVVGILAAGLIIGVIIILLIWRLTTNGNKQVVTESSHTVVESIRKVFKIVCAEGHFNELYNFEETKKILGFIPSTKRALVIIEAKVLVGFDFEKCKWELDETRRTIKLMSFPEPQILSIEPDYKYYNFDEGIFNLLNRKDLTDIQANGKKQVEISAIKSHLPRIAAEQMRTILLEVVKSKNWHLENTYKITEPKKIA
jgi:predicted membrane protein